MRTSDLLEELAVVHPGPRLAIGDIAEALGERGFGVLILVLALPNAIPGPAVPGLSAIFAVPMMLLAAQLALGRAEPRLPRWLMRRSAPLPRFARFVERWVPYLRRVEGWLRPRPGWLLRRRGLPALGGVLLFFSLVLALPIPFANTPIAASLIVIALALMERDGRALAAGLALGALSSLWAGGLIFAGARIAEALAAGR